MTENRVILACEGCGAKNRFPVSRMDEHPKCGKCGQELPVHLLSRPMEISDATFDREVLGSELPVLVDCWAPWCGPCKAFAPVLDELAAKYRGRLKVAKLNLDDNPATGSRFGVTSVPTVMLVKNGTIQDTLVGALPKEQLEYRIAGIL